ncbi:MAG: UDP-galactose-lipid carrier transferase [Leptospirales bacterium]|nr:UDP-galactose-lipid carrier transferase [Leptospirales bacterium]
MNGRLDALDLSLALSPDSYENQLRDLRAELQKLVARLIRKKRYAILVFEGKDAAGKGGVIRRLTAGLAPEHYSVITTAAPEPHERARHYLWRFCARLPESGRLVIFDRSWYGRVLVERVEGFAKEEEWRRAYREINDLERSWANAGMRVGKFWLEIGQDEQMRRFQSRAESPLKSWKITDEDWRNRDKWPQYKEAIEEMLARTDAPHARWNLIEANDKRFARIKTLRTVAALLGET